MEFEEGLVSPAAKGSDLVALDDASSALAEMGPREAKPSGGFRSVAVKKASSMRDL